MKQLSKEDIALLDLPRKEFIDACLAWIKEVNNGELFNTEMEIHPGEYVNNPTTCLLHQWFLHNDAKCKNEMVSLTAQCVLCGNPVCPDCMNHNVDQLSRVTGYMAPVSGWNASKKQEFKDRIRHEV